MTDKEFDVFLASGEWREEIDRLNQSVAFYERRCDLLQMWQNKMRDPERTIVCDVLANGDTLPPDQAGDRYTIDGKANITDYKSLFEQAVRTLAAIDEALGIGDDGCGDPDQTLHAIAELKALQKMEAPQLRKIHPLDFPIEVFLADLTTRPANIIRAELAGFASYAGTGTFDIEPPFTVRHLCMFSRSEIRKWPNFGRKCLNEVEEMLRARGLQLWDHHDERSLRLLREHKEYFK